jgi:hypothetical protein
MGSSQWGISNYYYDPYGGNYTHNMFDNYIRQDGYGDYSWNWTELYDKDPYYYDKYGYDPSSFFEYDGLDVYISSWGTYNNYFYDPENGNYTYNEEYNYYDWSDSGIGNYSWNTTNIGYKEDGTWYYILVDNSFFCQNYGDKLAYWYLACNPWNNMSMPADPYGNNDWWGMSNYYYDPYGGNYSFDSNYNYYYHDD